MTGLSARSSPTDDLAQLGVAVAAAPRRDERRRERERDQVIDHAEKQQRGEQRLLRGRVQHAEHEGLEHADPARRMARPAHDGRRDIDRAERQRSHRLGFGRQKRVDRQRRAAEIGDPDRELRQKHARARHLQRAAEDLQHARLAGDEDPVGAEPKAKQQTRPDIGQPGQMIDLRERDRAEDEPERGERRHAEPEGERRKERDRHDLARGETRLGVDPVARRDPRQERKAEREGEGVAGERGEARDAQRRAPVEHVQRQKVVTQERDIGGERRRGGEEEASRRGRLERGDEFLEAQIDDDAAEKIHRAGEERDGERRAEPAPQAMRQDLARFWRERLRERRRLDRHCVPSAPLRPNSSDPSILPPTPGAILNIPATFPRER